MPSLSVTFYVRDHEMPPEVKEAVAGLSRRVYSLDPDEAFDWIDRHREREQGRFVAAQGDEVVGYLSVLQPQDDLADALSGLDDTSSSLVEVWGLMVAPGQRREGIGSEMLLRAVDFARGLKMEPFGLVRVENRAAQKFFEDIQWRRWGEYGDGRWANFIYLCPSAGAGTA